MIETNKIHCMDCIEGMKQMDDNSVDLIVTDPPYGIKRDKLNMGKGGGLSTNIDYGIYNWDDSIPSKSIFEEMFRISKHQIIFGGNYMTKFLPSSSCWIVWDKDNGTNDFADCELAWTSFNTAVRKFKYRWNGMLQENMASKEVRYHPTQKPVVLFRRILKKYSKNDMIICDPFMGSGTTAIACIQTGRRFIGFEREQKYVDIAKKRINEAVAQPSLDKFNLIKTNIKDWGL